MFVKSVADRDSFSGECDLIVSDGSFELLCYCHNSDLSHNAQVKEIESFLCDNIMRSLSEEYLTIKTEGYYSYHLQGKVITCNVPTICIGMINIKLDAPLPKDIKEGEFIVCDVLRLDAWLH